MLFLYVQFRVRNFGCYISMDARIDLFGVSMLRVSRPLDAECASVHLLWVWLM